ncbi:MAG TPA: glycogen synthase [Candidatus Dormibacteraeota bacterium]
MKVALLTREYPPEIYGGAGVHVEYLARELSRLVNLQVHCFGGPRQSPLVAASYEPWDELAGPELHLAALRTMSVDLAMVAGVQGVDLAHSHTWYANFAGHLAKLLYGIPHVMTTHSLEPLRPWKAEQLGGGYAVSSFCERTAIESADAVIAVSTEMRGDVLRAYPAVDPARVRVIHGGVDPDEYQPDHATDVLQRYGIDPARPIVLYFGRISRQKGIVHLLEAAPMLQGGAELVLRAGPADTEEQAEEVRELVRDLQARRGGVVLIEELLPRRDLVQLLTHAAVFVCPSIYEPFGLVNLEAMACRTPVVASKVGGILDIVVDGVTGILVGFEPGDDAYGRPADPARFAHDLAAAVNKVLADPELARALGDAGRQRVVDEFSWSEIARRTEQLYQELLSAGAASRGAASPSAPCR